MLQRFTGVEGPNLVVEALEMQPVVAGESNLAAILSDAVVLEAWASGEAIMEEGSAGNDIYFILAGAASVIVHGREVAVREAGEEVGEMALLHPGQTRSATVVAKGEAVTASLSASAFRELADSRPVLWRNVARVLADRLRQRNLLVSSRNAVPVLFIGCSSEALPIAKAIESRMSEDGITVRLWTTGVFRASNFTLESLETALSHSDFAALVLSPDDEVTSRDETLAAPRDNVVFELGLFMGALGHARTFLIRPGKAEIKMPTDLAGLTALPYFLEPGENGFPDVSWICEEIFSIIQAAGTR